VRAARSNSTGGQSGCTSKTILENLDAIADLLTGDFPTQIREFVNLQHFNVSPKISALLREIGIDIEHPAVIMAHDS